MTVPLEPIETFYLYNQNKVANYSKEKNNSNTLTKLINLFVR